MNRRRRLGLAALGLLAIAVLLAGMLANGRARITTDIFELLPESRRDPLAAQAMAQTRDAFFDKLTAVLVLPDEAGAADLVRHTADALAENGIEMTSIAEQMARLQAFYAQQPFAFLTAADRAELELDASAAFSRHLAASLLRPGGFDPEDPAGHLARFLAGLPRGSASWSMAGGHPARWIDGKLHVVLNGRIDGDPMDAQVQEDVAQAFELAAADLRATCASCVLHWSGPIRFAKATRNAAETDITRLSTAATLGIVLLFAMIFRAVAPLMAAIGTLATSVLAGLTASLAVFGQIHALTLVFGTTLLGLCIDYVVHFLVHRYARPRESSEHALSAVAPGMLLGLTTSCMAFAFLLLSGFPALSQLAVFALTGLATAWLSVRLVISELVSPRRGDTFVARLLQRERRLPASVRPAVLGLLFVAAAFGMTRLAVVDDVRGLQAVPPDVARDARIIDQTTADLPGIGGGARFVLIEAPDIDAALAREASLFVHAGAGFGLSRFLPDASLRAANISAWTDLFTEDASALQDILARFGFEPRVAAALTARYRSALPSTSQLAESAALASLRPLVVATNDGFALVARLPEGLPDNVPPGVREVDALAEIETTFAAVRERGAIAVMSAYMLMLLILSWRYGFRGGLRALMPALLGAFTAMGLLGLSGLPLNVFSLVGLVLVLGVGADYALFLREARNDVRAARFATLLAAMTSVLSFGLLAFSSLPALQAFGFTTGSGVLVAFLAAPLAGRAPMRGEAEEVQTEAFDRAA